jgi:hypothetical protein
MNELSLLYELHSRESRKPEYCSVLGLINSFILVISRYLLEREREREREREIAPDFPRAYNNIYLSIKKIFSSNFSAIAAVLGRANKVFESEGLCPAVSRKLRAFKNISLY